MIYTVKRIDEDLDFGCEERVEGALVMAVVTLIDSSGEELKVKAELPVQKRTMSSISRKSYKVCMPEGVSLRAVLSLMP